MGNLDKILSSLNKKYKSVDTGLLTKASDQFAQIDWISTNIYALDRVMGKGLPRGRIVEIWGSSASGKSTTALQIIAAIQRQGGTAAFIDAEQTYNDKWAEACGIDNNNLLLVKPDYGEQALSIVEDLIDTGELDLIVVDSIPGLLPKAIADKDVGESTIGEQARMMSKFLQKVTGKLAKTKTSLILINQTRTKIGVMYGDPTALPGGAAVEFYASVILKVGRDKKRTVFDKQTNDPIGHIMIVKNTKNKVSSPFREAEYMFFYNKGVDNRQTIVEEAIAKGVIVKPESGPTYRIFMNGEEHKIIGVGNIVDYLDEHKDVARYVVETAGIPDYYKNAFETHEELNTEIEIKPSVEEEK